MKRKNRNFWTKEICQKESLKYKKRSDFKIGSGGAYNCAIKNKWLDEICSHMKPVGHRYKRLIYAYEFEDGHVYVGLTFDIKERDCRHKTSGKSEVFKHMKKTNAIPKLVLCSEFVDVEEAKILEGKILESYKSKGFTALNLANTGATGGGLKWTFEKCKKEALECKTRMEFVNKNESAYNSARRYGWLDELCSHMDIVEKKEKGFWTYEKCKEEVSKCKKIGEINIGAYHSILRNNWKDEICSHLNIQKPNGYWTKERCHEEAKKYKTSGELQKNNNCVYSISCSKKWLSDFFPK